MMDSKSKPAAESRGRTRELERLHQNGAATAREIREFVGQLRSKRPQEMLGVVAHSGLAQSIGVSAVGFLLLIALLTVGPYAWGKVFGTAPKAKPEVAAKEAPDESADQAADKDAAATKDASTAEGQELDAAAAAEKMGEAGVKEGVPDDLDDLLDKVP